MSQSIRQGAGRCQMTIFSQRLYHPIIKVRLCRFSCRDVYSIFRNIVGYQGLHLMHLLFICDGFMMMGLAEAK
jgi:hypothetical protein